MALRATAPSTTPVSARAQQFSKRCGCTRIHGVATAARQPRAAPHIAAAPEDPPSSQTEGCADLNRLQRMPNPVLASHRDIKPGNVLVDPMGTLKLIDFGIARPLDRALQTENYRRFLTLANAAPEQLRSDPPGTGGGAVVRTAQRRPSFPRRWAKSRRAGALHSQRPPATTQPGHPVKHG